MLSLSSPSYTVGRLPQFKPWLCSLSRKAFTPPPKEPLWRWADREVKFKKQHSAKPQYDSRQTPWCRWMMDIWQHPFRNRKGRQTRIRRVRIKKCTQSGFTESLLNGIRHDAKYRPKNFIYSINSKVEAENVRERLVDTLENLGQHIFKEGENADELGNLTLRLREMTGWFIGSHSEGAYANKPAPRTICDEYDDHAVFKNNTTTLKLLEERLKTFDEEGLGIALGKPQLAGGPIDTEHATGDQYEWMVPCPHCGTCQLLEWKRVRFKHCKDLFGAWNRERVLAETYYECVSGCHIEEASKEWMEENGRWWLVKYGDPETVSLHMSDLHSMHKGSTLGHLALEFIDANEAAAKGNFTLLQAFWNGRLGLGFEQRVEKFCLIDVMNCRSAYRRGTIPVAGTILCTGMDVGLYVNTKWVNIALHPATVEAWIIDWGLAGEPNDLLTIMDSKRYPCPASGLVQGIALAFIDIRYKSDKVTATALQRPRLIYPMMGLPSQTIARAVSMDHVPGLPEDFGVIKFKKEGANSDLYLDRIKGRRPPLIHFPEDTDEPFMLEFTNERLIRDPVTKRLSWAPKPAGPNHWADATENVLTGYDYLIDGPRSRAAVPTAGVHTAPADQPAEEIG